MRTNGTTSVETAAIEFDQYVRYADGDGTIICDRTNPTAWIRSTELWPCRR
ncbi:DUF7331 family protein [Halopiger djelfimassiliensis]|uniref:DUF7331 family protein n=1 Tax=Halopiger djelfimassiliensis TaxID=1293047 RepID=UPI000AE46A6A|nr:hypothetical protein [Halopiger djelfimassiliensis]